MHAARHTHRLHCFFAVALSMCKYANVCVCVYVYIFSCVRTRILHYFLYNFLIDRLRSMALALLCVVYARACVYVYLHSCRDKDVPIFFLLSQNLRMSLEAAVCCKISIILGIFFNRAQRICQPFYSSTCARRDSSANSISRNALVERKSDSRAFDIEN